MKKVIVTFGSEEIKNIDGAYGCAFPTEPLQFRPSQSPAETPSQGKSECVSCFVAEDVGKHLMTLVEAYNRATHKAFKAERKKIDDLVYVGVRDV